MSVAPADTVARRLARLVVDLRTARLPDALLARARDFLLDFFGVTLGGAPEPSSAALRRGLERLALRGEVPVVGCVVRLPAPHAALANGAAAHALEMDDTHLAGSIHLGAPVWPAALAAAALAPATGDALLRAGIAGYEVAARLATALRPAEHYARGLHPTGTCGAFGATAAAGLVLGLDADALVHAFGIAGSQGAGSLEFLADGSWTKRLHPGWAASAGVHAAAFAGAGFRGPATIVEGRFGVLHAWSADADARALDGDGDWAMLRTGMKPHACCRYMQGPIDAMLALRAAHALVPDDVARIEVGIVSAGFPLVCEPLAQKRRPTSVVDAQFSLPFGLAVACVRGAAGPDQFAAPVFDDPIVTGLAARVVPVRDATLDACYPRTWPAWVQVERRDGTRVVQHVEHPLGDPEQFPTAQVLQQKFRTLGTRSLDDASLARLARLVAETSAASDAAALAEAARPPTVT